MDIKLKKNVFKCNFILLVFVFFGINKTFSQNQFSLGYNNGFKAGYCYNKGGGCISPLPPVPPVPNYPESFYNFQDGYNRGFIDGRGKASNIQTENQSPYGREAYRPDIKPFVPDYNSFHSALKNRTLELENQKEASSRFDSFIQNWNSRFSSQNNASSKLHADIIRNYYKTLIKTSVLPQLQSGGNANVFVIVTYPPTTSSEINSRGTQVYSGLAINGKGIYANEIVLLSFETFAGEEMLYKKYSKTYDDDIKFYRDRLSTNPCPSMNSFIELKLFNGKATGSYNNEWLVFPESDIGCKNIKERESIITKQIEVYFIEALEQFNK
jgi:hypothetical protein